MRRMNAKLLRTVLASILVLSLALQLCACTSGRGENRTDTGVETLVGNTTDGAVDSSVNAKADATEEDGAVITYEIAASEGVQPDDNYRNYYEIFVGSFCDSNGDGLGDIPGITSKLDYISYMGFTGIWLTPMMASPSYHKYDTTDYYLVDPGFGTNEDFAELASECHKRGIKLIIDLVINHSSSEHPWFTTSCEYLRSLSAGEEPDLQVCPYVDYYHFSREQVNGSYKQVTGSDWYYEAVFDYTQPDLNLANESLYAELCNVADFWMDLGVDGFRMDAVMHYEENETSFNNEFLNNYYEYCLGRKNDFYMVSEVWAAKNIIANYYESGTPSFFNFDASGGEGKIVKAAKGNAGVDKLVNAMAEYDELYGSVNADFIDAPFITNHDMVRVANALMSDEDALKMAGGLLLTMSGNPFVYYGEEIGMSSKGTKDENKRLPYLWTGTEEDGYVILTSSEEITNTSLKENMCEKPKGADEDVQQKLPGFDEQLLDEASLLHYYRNALLLRNRIPEIARGKTTVIDSLTEGKQAVITRAWNDSVIAIVYNTDETPFTFDLSLSEEISGMEIAGELEIGSDCASLSGNSLTLPGRSIVILK